MRHRPAIIRTGSQSHDAAPGQRSDPGFQRDPLEAIEMLCQMLNRRVCPVDSGKGLGRREWGLGSVGPSRPCPDRRRRGVVEGKRMESAEALRAAGFNRSSCRRKKDWPFSMGLRPCMPSVVLRCFRATRLARVADVSGAMAMEGVEGYAGRVDRRLQTRVRTPAKPPSAAHLSPSVEGVKSESRIASTIPGSRTLIVSAACPKSTGPSVAPFIIANRFSDRIRFRHR